jgi:hypothetical protein
MEGVPFHQPTPSQEKGVTMSTIEEARQKDPEMARIVDGDKAKLKEKLAQLRMKHNLQQKSPHTPRQQDDPPAKVLRGGVKVKRSPSPLPDDTPELVRGIDGKWIDVRYI